MIVGSSDLAKRAAPLLRAELRAGKLGLEEAAKAVELAAALWGGLDGRSLFDDEPMTDEKLAEAEEERQKEREPLAAFLGPPELRGPPTAEEWALLRAIRRAHADAEGMDAHELLAPLPPGPWEPEERALLDWAVEAVKSGNDKPFVTIAMALASKPSVETYPLFAVLKEHGPERGEKLLRLYQEDAAQALGIEVERGGEGGDEDGEGAEEAVEWMDEPE